MCIGEVFNNSKWDIIKDLSLQKLSPIQLAEKYNTTLGNVGHQLRILEAYGLVKKEKITNRDKGKPRMLFSLAKDYAYLVSATKGFAQKKLLHVTDYHDTILKMWFLKDSRFHYYLEKFYWKIEEYMGKVNGMAFRILGDNSIEVVALTNSKRELTKQLGPKMTLKNRDGTPVDFKINVVNENDLKSLDSIRDFHIVYDPNEMLNCFKQSFQVVN